MSYLCIKGRLPAFTTQHYRDIFLVSDIGKKVCYLCVNGRLSVLSTQHYMDIFLAADIGKGCPTGDSKGEVVRVGRAVEDMYSW